ncbi:MAG: hypothetical protein GVY16_03590 [Planctomycetes bacterium]|nr:hypothetical protein [Planctomycetota bacterium]
MPPTALGAGAQTTGFAVLGGESDNDFPQFGPQNISLLNGPSPRNGWPYPSLASSGLLVRDLGLLPPLPPTPPAPTSNVTAGGLTFTGKPPVLWDVTNRTPEGDWASDYIDMFAGEGGGVPGQLAGGQPLVGVLNMLNAWFVENTPTQSAVYFYSWR